LCIRPSANLAGQRVYVDELSPFITALFNASFRDGCFPSSQKCGVVIPALKKPILDPSDTNNYRPISKLAFISSSSKNVAPTTG